MNVLSHNSNKKSVFHMTDFLPYLLLIKTGQTSVKSVIFMKISVVPIFY